MNTGKTHKYSVMLKGYGGEYSCVPLTAEQAAYWRKKGDDKLAAHLSFKGEEGDGIPAKYQLPDYREQGQDFVVGLDLDAGVELTVEDENRLKLNSDDEDFTERQNFSREIGPFGGPPEEPVAMYRTVLKGANLYNFTTNKPLDPTLLTLDCAEISRWGDVIISVTYDGEEAELFDPMDREMQDPVAELLAKPSDLN